MNADQIRKELRRLAQVRASLEADLEKVRDDQAAAVKAANDCEGITMSEAIKLSGLSRPSVYELLKRSARSSAADEARGSSSES